MVGTGRQWSWEEFGKLPFEEIPCDIHCVTKWSKLRHQLRRRLAGHAVREAEPLDAFATAYSYGGYTTNLPIEEITEGGRGW